jgi:hypothetical protein
MANPVLTILSKLARKLAMALLIAVLTLLACALWLFVGEHGDYAEHRALRIGRVEARYAETSKQLADVTLQTDLAAESLTAQQSRLAQAEKVLKSLHELDPGTFERLIGDKAQQDAHDERIARTVRIKTETQTRIVELQREVVTGERRKAELQAAVDALESERASLREEKSAVGHYVRTAWIEGAWIVYTAFFAYLFGGLAVAALLYFGWARMMAKKLPLQLRKGDVALPTFGECGTLIEHMLWPGERLWVRKRLLQSADTALTRKTRLLPDWRSALSWWLAGCAGLIELRNERSNGERQVVFTHMNDQFAELMVVSVPEGGSIVLRAGHVMGLISDIGRTPVIRRHWRLGSWYSWVAGRFGYFEFHGPCRIVVSCISAVSDHTLRSPEENKPNLVRMPLAGMVGFTPQLLLVPVRKEGFWSYCRRETPLFELQVAGTGAYLAREVDRRGGDRLKARILKRFGL